MTFDSVPSNEDNIINFPLPKKEDVISLDELKTRYITLQAQLQQETNKANRYRLLLQQVQRKYQELQEEKEHYLMLYQEEQKKYEYTVVLYNLEKVLAADLQGKYEKAEATKQQYIQLYNQTQEYLKSQINTANKNKSNSLGILEENINGEIVLQKIQDLWMSFKGIIKE